MSEPVRLSKPSAPPAAPPRAPAPLPPAPPPPTVSGYEQQSARPRRRAGRTIGGVIGVLIVLGIKLFAVIGVGHLLHGASFGVIVVVLILVGFLVRWVTRFLGR